MNDEYSTLRDFHAIAFPPREDPQLPIEATGLLELRRGDAIGTVQQGEWLLSQEWKEMGESLPVRVVTHSISYASLGALIEATVAGERDRRGERWAQAHAAFADAVSSGSPRLMKRLREIADAREAEIFDPIAVSRDGLLDATWGSGHVDDCDTPVTICPRIGPKEYALPQLWVEPNEYILFAVPVSYSSSVVRKSAYVLSSVPTVLCGVYMFESCIYKRMVRELQTRIFGQSCRVAGEVMTLSAMRYLVTNIDSLSNAFSIKWQDEGFNDRVYNAQRNIVRDESERMVRIAQSLSESGEESLGSTSKQFFRSVADYYPLGDVSSF